MCVHWSFVTGKSLWNAALALLPCTPAAQLYRGPAVCALIQTFQACHPLGHMKPLLPPPPLVLLLVSLLFPGKWELAWACGPGLSAVVTSGLGSEILGLGTSWLGV